MGTKTFKCKKEVNFTAGAGVVIGVTAEMGIFSCPYNSEMTTYLNYFGDVKI